MTGAEFALGLVRGVHIAAAMSILGAMAFQAVVARSAASPSVQLADRRIYRVISASLVLAFLTACAWLPLEAASVTDNGTVDQIAAALPIVLWDSHFGSLLIGRIGLLILACLLFRAHPSSWLRTVSILVAAIAVLLQVGLGHGLSMEGSTGALLIAAEGVHLIAAALWLGGLLPLLILVSTLEPESAAPAVGRFSHLGTACVFLLAITIVVQSWVLIGGIAGFIGTEYGWIALFKGAMFLILLGAAALNRWWFTPQLGATDGARGKRLLARSIAIESGFGLLAILGAGLLLTQSPAIHEQPYWPFGYQLSLEALTDPDLGAEVRLGIGQALFGLLAVAAGCVFFLFRKRRIGAIAVAIAALPLWWSSSHLGLLLVPAYPTSFYQSPTGFTAAAIVQGSKLFPSHCVSCHGAEGRGDGALAKTLPVPPADLTASHLFGHSDGELFWWLSHGIEGPEGGLVMPGFAGELDDYDRWNLIDYIRAHNIGLALAETGAPPQPVLAPDMTVSVNGNTIPLSNRRGQFIRLVAVDQKRQKVPELPNGNGIAITTLTIAPGSDGWTAYAVMVGVPPEQLAGTEFLIDRAGWLRAVLRPKGDGLWPDQSDAVAAARQAEANPIQDSSGGQMHHHH